MVGAFLHSGRPPQNTVRPSLRTTPRPPPGVLYWEEAWVKHSGLWDAYGVGGDWGRGAWGESGGGEAMASTCELTYMKSL